MFEGDGHHEGHVRAKRSRARARRSCKKHGVDWVDGAPIAKSNTVQDYLEEAPMIWEGSSRRNCQKRRDPADQDAGGDQAEGGAERLLRGDARVPRRVPRERAVHVPGTAEEAYAEIDKFAEEALRDLRQAADFNKQEELFELPVSKYRNCRKRAWNCGCSRTCGTSRPWSCSCTRLEAVRCGSKVDTDKLEDAEQKSPQTL